MERELLVTGIGGQGVQLVATCIARAATAEGRGVQLFGSYGGMMRGGNTEATVVVADGPVESPPTVTAAWSAILMHHEHSRQALDRLRAGAVVLVNSTVFADPPARPGRTVVEVPASAIAAGLGNVMAASMVMAGAYAAATGLVSLDALRAAAAAALPAYRAQHAARNDEALTAGAAAVTALLAPAWTHEPAAVP